MGLSVLAGPANAGKVALLLERYLAKLDEEPFLIVPNRSDVDRVERDLLRRSPALLAGSIGTFDDLFARLSRGLESPRAALTEVQRALLVRRVIGAASLNGLGQSARFGGFADALGQTIRELEAGLLDPSDVDGALARVYGAYRNELERLGRWDRDLLRRQAVDRLERDLDAWSGQPVFAYGFEDLTAAEWALVNALAGRAEVLVSIPYEAGRPAFESLRETVEDLASLASGRIEELGPRYGEYAPPALAHLERTLFGVGTGGDPPPLEGEVRFFEAAGHRGVLELVGEEVLELLRAGTAAEEIAIVCPSLERWRAPLETAFGTLGIPFALEGRIRLDRTPYGQALLGLLRFEWLGGRDGADARRDLYGFLRSPYSGVPRRNIDFLEGRLRGRAISGHERVEEETVRLRGTSFPLLEALRAAPSMLAAVRSLAESMLRAAYGQEAPPVGEGSRQDLRACEAVTEVLDELQGWLDLGGALAPEEIVAALERMPVRLAGAGEAGRVAVLDLLRARTRNFEFVFVLGLEQGSLPRREQSSPFLADDERRVLDEAGKSRIRRPDAVARDRYLFYTACTRALRRLYLVREAASDEGSPREASPFWDEARSVFRPDDVQRWTRRRALSELTWPLEHAPTERERLRALALLSVNDDGTAEALAAANGWERRLHRARQAHTRPTRLSHPVVLAALAERTTFGVTELERFADCSSAWFVERLLEPRTIDATLDAKLRGSVAHQALYRFFSGLPKELGSERVDADRLEAALAFLRRCLDEAVGGVRMELTGLQRLELFEGLWRDLSELVRQEAASELPLVPRRFEVLFGSERAAPELQRGLELGGGIALSGKIDRIDLDPGSARGIVQDYKSGKSAFSAAQIEKELRLQLPLYMLVLRDLVGVEPLGGVYRPLAGERRARGLLRAEAKGDVLPGFVRTDYLSEDEFWRKVEAARESAHGFAERIRAGDVRHDPRGGECPTWCDLWPMCRVRRA